MNTIEIEKIKNIIRHTKQFFDDEIAISDISIKGDSDYVTQVDYNVQNYLKCEFNKIYPDFVFSKKFL